MLANEMITIHICILLVLNEATFCIMSLQWSLIRRQEIYHSTVQLGVHGEHGRVDISYFSLWRLWRETQRLLRQSVSHSHRTYVGHLFESPRLPTTTYTHIRPAQSRDNVSVFSELWETLSSKTRTVLVTVDKILTCAREWIQANIRSGVDSLYNIISKRWELNMAGWWYS